MPSGVWVTLHSLNLPEDEFCELRLNGVLRSSKLGGACALCVELYEVLFSREVQVGLDAYLFSERVAVALVATQDPAALPIRHILRITDLEVSRPDLYSAECVERLYEKSSNTGEPPRHEANHGSLHQRFPARTQPLVIFAHPPLLVDP